LTGESAPRRRIEIQRHPPIEAPSRTAIEWHRIPDIIRRTKRRKIASSDDGHRMMAGDRRRKATAFPRRFYQGTIEHNKPNGV
jgi:hypothetical protein